MRRAPAHDTLARQGTQVFFGGVGRFEAQLVGDFRPRGGMPVSLMARWMRRRISVWRGVRSDMADSFKEESGLRICTL
jgi:hypothetical protein